MSVTMPEKLTLKPTLALALRFTLEQGVTAAIPPGEEFLFRMALDLATDLRPLTEAERTRLAAMAVGRMDRPSVAGIPIWPAPF